MLKEFILAKAPLRKKRPAIPCQSGQRYMRTVIPEIFPGRVLLSGRAETVVMKPPGWIAPGQVRTPALNSKQIKELIKRQDWATSLQAGEAACM